MNVVIVLVVLIVLGYPLFQRRTEELPVETYMDRRFRELLSRKEVLYSAIKELDFDFKTDKISREDYQELGESIGEKRFLFSRISMVWRRARAWGAL